MRTFVILDTTELSSVDFNQVAEINVESCRKSVDGTKTFVKFQGETPSFLTGQPQYTHEEMLSILDGPGWAAEVMMHETAQGLY